jgi:hypothetical protein
MVHQIADAAKAHGTTTLHVVRSGETVVAVGPQDVPPFSNNGFCHR